MNVRGGKYGDDKVFIIYSFKTENSEDIGYGHVDMGTIPYLIIYDLSTSKIIKDGIKMDNFVMNTNEDLKTFNDGVLIWASTNKDGKLIIHKIGTPLLNEAFDDIKYILTKDDLIDGKEKEKENDEKDKEKENDEKDKEKENDEKNSSISTKVKVIIIIAIIIFTLLLIFAIYKLIRCLCFKKENEEINGLDEDGLVN